MEKTVSETSMHNFKDNLEVGELRDKLSEAELKKVSGGYIGETEKNVSRGKTTS
jgi:hypothetical protein